LVDSLELVEDLPLRERELIVPTAEVANIITLAEDVDQPGSISSSAY